MKIETKEMKTKIGEWILWRWIDDKTFSKSKVQNIEESPSGDILELNDNDTYTNYPTRVLRSEIFIAKSFKK